LTPPESLRYFRSMRSLFRLRTLGLAPRSLEVLFVLATLSLPTAGQDLATRPKVLVVPGGGGEAGEVGLFDSQGRAVVRLTGLGEPTHLAPSREGRFFVTDQAGGRVLELDTDASVHWSWTAPPNGPHPWSATPLSGGNLLLACGLEGVAEIDGSGAVIFKAPSPITGAQVLDAVRLPDGSTLLTVRERERFLFRLRPGESEASQLDLPVEEKFCSFPRLCGLTAEETGEVILWDPQWGNAYRLGYQHGSLRLLEKLPCPGCLQLTPWHDLGVLFSRGMDWTVGTWSQGASGSMGQMNFAPTGLLPAAGAGQYLASYVRQPDGSWPESYPPPPAESRVDWNRFWLWILGGLGVTFGLHLASWRLARRWKEPDSAEKQECHAEAVEPPKQYVLLRLVVTGLFLGGAGACAWGQHLMHRGYSKGWLVFSIGGAVVAAVTLEAWRRFGRREGDLFWEATVAARPDLRLWPVYLIGLAIVTAGCVVLFRSRMIGDRYTQDVGLWAALFIVLIGMCALSGSPPWRWSRRAAPSWRVLLAPGLPVLVAMVTLFYRLRDIPANIHFDFVFYALAGWNLMQGRFASIWDNGFVPAPVIGLLPEMAGLAITGPGELGFRLGGALFGLTGIVAVYILGCCYRDRKTGFLAALFLAGSIPFIHFSRTTANGDAATAGLWTITLFVVAVRFGHPRWWILSGLAAGYCFFLWPGARIAIVACFAWGLVLGMRSPRAARRRWLGIPLAAASFVVWLVPVVPMWLTNSRLALPRVDESLEVYKPAEGVHWDRVKASFGTPLAESFGWFFVAQDNSSQGTLSPGCNRIEAVLLGVGLGIVLLEGCSINLLFVGFIFGVLVTLGAWSGSPPWYTRLVPTAPIAALLMARTLTGALDIAGTSRRVSLALAGAVAVVVLMVSPVRNFLTYVKYETGPGFSRGLWEMTAIGRRIQTLGSRYHYYLVTTKRNDWNVDYRQPNGRFGELLPFIWGRHVTEARELEAKLPLSSGEPAAIIVQAARFTEDVNVVKKAYPNAKVEEIKGFGNERLAGIVLVEQP
jgi:4-amino-4-deoxy-L-arabinose transferase-like glycosyltransferase